MYSIPGRIHYNQIGLILEFIYHFEHIASQKLAVLQSIEFGVYLG